MASRSWNRVELIGNLTRDPELRFTPNGSAVCTFGIATNRTYMVEGERKEEVDFHRLVAWNKLAELCNQLLKKGDRAFISGRLQTRSWEGQDGQQRQTTEIVIEDMILLTSRNSESGVTASTISTSEDVDADGKKEPVEPKPKSVPKVTAVKEPVKTDIPEETVEQVAPKEDVDDLPF